MNIETVKIQGNGYLLNGTMSVPKADGNSEYEAIKQWLAEGNTPEPEFTQAELDAMALVKMKAEAQSYLDDTDYKDLPSYKPKAGEDLAAIMAKRDEARSFLRGEIETWSAE